MKVLTVVGARPQFIKAAPVSKVLRNVGHTEYLVHTGQHYDYGMSQVFFDELETPEPDINLDIGSGSHGSQTGHMLIGVELVLQEQRPDVVLVYGDTNSTIAAALAAVKLNIPVAHVEAGLRSFNRTMPEEHNRVLTDHCAKFLFCPTQTAVSHLANEGITHRVYLVGDTMYDAVMQFGAIAQQRSSILQKHSLRPGHYLVATVHRPYNTDISENLFNILAAFVEANETIILPLHPRTKSKIGPLMKKLGLDSPESKVVIIEPVGYLDMLTLQQNARIIMTDSGGIQKEAYFLSVPCITLRPETEWTETVDNGWNVLVHADRETIIVTIVSQEWPHAPSPSVFGDGQASKNIVQILGHLVT